MIRLACSFGNAFLSRDHTCSDSNNRPTNTALIPNIKCTDNQVGLQLFTVGYNLGNSFRYAGDSPDEFLGCGFIVGFGEDAHDGLGV